MAQAKQVKTRLKKKHWVPIYAPKSFSEVFLGETSVMENERVPGKSITANLMVLTDDPRKQSYNVRFDIVGVKEGKAQTQVIGIEMMPSAVKRLIRRNRDKIDDSFIVRIAGGRKIRIKPVLVTKTKASNSAQTRIRLLVREKLTELYRKMRFDDIVLDIIDMKTQRLLRDMCSKIHPVRSADIRELVVSVGDRKITPAMAELMEKEVAEEEARRAQIASAAAAASVQDENVPTVKSRKRKSEPADEGPEDMGV